MESNREAEEEMNMRYVRCVDHGTRFMDLDNLVVEMCDKCRVVDGKPLGWRDGRKVVIDTGMVPESPQERLG